jgi:type IV secretion system protein VirD4
VPRVSPEAHLHDRLYLGEGAGGPLLAPPEVALLVVGPPRSGKTRGLVVPNVLGARGAVVSTSTKPDVLRATAAARRVVGPVYLYDPTGTRAGSEDVEPLVWSPVGGAANWEDALALAHSLVAASRPAGLAGESAHWLERAEALLAPCLHAAALDGRRAGDLTRWILRHDLVEPMAVLDACGSTVAADALAGIVATDPRERSGILSTAASVLSAYRSAAALAAAEGPPSDLGRLLDERATIYIAAGRQAQGLVAPLVTALVDEVRRISFARAAEAGARRRPATLLALDEVANVAPLPELPALVAEGGGQGVLTLACFQDLSQARARFGPEADGLLSLFGAKVFLPGVAERTTLELVSLLAGEEDVPVVSIGRHRGRRLGERHVTAGFRRQARLPPDRVAAGRPGEALVVLGGRPLGHARLPGVTTTREGPSVTGRQTEERSPPRVASRRAVRLPPGGLGPREVGWLQSGADRARRRGAGR